MLIVVLKAPPARNKLDRQSRSARKTLPASWNLLYVPSDSRNWFQLPHESEHLFTRCGIIIWLQSHPKSRSRQVGENILTVSRGERKNATEAGVVLSPCSQPLQKKDCIKQEQYRVSGGK